jgi:hypothetical protein
VNLVVGLYIEPNKARHAEIKQCLVANLANPFFGRVVVVEENPHALASYVEDVDPESIAKIRRVGLGQRMTYDDAFFLARISFDPAPWVLANNDIEFDDTIAHAGNVQPRELWCVTRTELDGGQLAPERAAWSQDAWIWRADTGRLDSYSAPFRADWHLGVLGCENRLAHAAAAAGFKLRNPGRNIRALHRHASGVRRSLDRYKGNGLSVPLDPITLRDCSRSSNTR